MKALQWVFLTASLGMLACGGPKGYVIRGEVTGLPDSTMVYLMNTRTGMNVDSAWIVGGRFLLQGVLTEEPERMYLGARLDQRSVYAFLLMGNERIDIKGDVTDFPRRVAISGSQYQDQQEVLNRLTREYDIRRDSLTNFFRHLAPGAQNDTAQTNAWRREIYITNRIVDSLRKGYLFSHTDTYPALIQLSYMMYDLPEDTVQGLFDKMSPELQASRYAKPVRTFLSCEAVSEGGPFFDFEAEDQNGRKLRLSELTGQDGKYVLLDFTAAWCGPCMMATKEMRRMVDTYSDSLRIVSFSVDNSRQEWEKALERDSVCWTSLWNDKEADSGEICIPYRIRGFPTFLLIDPQGKIVQRWSGYGPGTFEEKIGRLKNK